MGGADNEACEAGRRERCVNLIQQGSAVPYNWFQIAKKKRKRTRPKEKSEET